MDTIKKLKHTLLTSFDVLGTPLEYVKSQGESGQQKFYRRWLGEVKRADIGVFEVSFPSTANVGLEIGSFIERGKPALCLYKHGRDVTFVGEYHSSRIIRLEYSNETVKEVLRWGIEEAEQMIHRRFTFFISPQIDSFLDKVTKTTGKSRSEYIRELIESQIKPQE